MPGRDMLQQFGRPSGAVVLSAAGPLLGAIVVVGLAVQHADTLREGGLGNGALLLIGGALAVGLFLLPTHALSLLCGWAFGLPAGLAVALAAVALGAPIGYGLGRVLAGPGLLRLVDENPKAAAVCEAVTQASPLRAAWLVALLRLSPVVPFGAMNVLSAAFALRLVPFLAGSVVGLAPRVAAVVALGAGLEQLTDDAPASPWLWGAGLGATVLAVLVISWIAKRELRRYSLAAEAAEA